MLELVTKMSIFNKINDDALIVDTHGTVFGIDLSIALLQTR